MILDGQFPTTVDYTNQIKATDIITSLGITDPDLTNAYQIGWVKWENLPSNLHVSQHLVNNGIMSLTDVTRPDNIDILLLSGTSNSLTPSQYYTACAAFSNTWDNFTSRNTGGTFTQNRFINELDVNTILYQSIFIAFLIGKNDTTNSFVYIEVSYTAIANGTLATTISYDGLTFDITDSDIDGTLKTVEKNGSTYKYACIDYGIIGGVRPINGSGYYAPFTSYLVHDVDDHAFLLGGGRPYPLYWDQTSGGGYRLNANTGALSYASTVDTYEVIDGSYYLWGGFSGDMAVSDLQNIPTYGMLYADGCNYFVSCHGRRDRCMLRRCMIWDDICKWAAMQMRYGATQEYATNADKYYAKISEENEFMGVLANGATDLAELRPWQIAGVKLDANSNEYTPDQKPPYTPEDNDEQNVGASILRPSTLGVGGTSGFITQYVLTAAEIATLGRTLWTSFINPDYWHNFLFSLALDTGSFDMSSLLDYFVSLRVYPFSLINVPSYAATGSPSIYIGSGVVPLTITGSTTLHTINNFADYIDAGSCTVHSAYFHDDFRDFSNVEIMLYLPYCGTVQLNPGDVVGGTLHAQYAIDFATGGCVAYVDLTSADGISYPIAVLPGSIGADVPLTATNAGQIAARFAGDVINFASTVTSNAASDLNTRASAATGAITGGASGAVSRSSIGAIATGGINAGLQHASQAIDMATRPAIGIPTLSGGRGFSSFGAPQTAYIQIRRGIYKRPQTYDHTVGAPSSASKTIGSLAGLVKGAVDTAGLSCTADEAAEVRTLIAAGIIV